MGLINRWHTGTARIDVGLLDDIDWVLDMDTAGPREHVRAVAEKVRADRYGLDSVDESGCHDWLEPTETDGVQRLRDSRQPDAGTVDAEALCAVRNTLNALTVSWGSGCDEFLPPDAKSNDICFECMWCKFLILRDRIDAALDRNGFVGNVYYQHYVLGDGDREDPEVVWRERIVPEPAHLAAR